jgi:hypothetical protein
MRAAGVIALALVVRMAQGQTPSPSAIAFAREVAGCYQLVPGPGPVDTTQSNFLPIDTWPGRFRLTIKRLEGWEQWQNDSLSLFQVDDLSERRTGPKLPWFWRRVSSAEDSIRVTWPWAMVGYGLVFVPLDQKMPGYLYSYSDNAADYQRQVRFKRIECPTS